MLCDDREGESSDLNERIKSLNQEILNYKWVLDESLKEDTKNNITLFTWKS